MDPHANILSVCQKYDVIEIFSGDAWVSTCFKSFDFATAALDIRYGKPATDKQDYMDLTSDAGFSPLLLNLWLEASGVTHCHTLSHTCLCMGKVCGVYISFLLVVLLHGY